MTEGELVSRFDKLLDRAPTDHEKRLLLQLQKQLGISDDDGLWLVLVILSHYEHLYKQIPGEIEAAGSFALERAKKRLEFETEAERKRIQGALTQAVLNTIEQTTVDRVKTERRRATAVAGAVSIALILVVGFGSYNWGFAKGEVSSDAAQLWSVSEQGQYARRLDEFGVLVNLRACQVSGGDFRITKERTVICETRGGRVHSIGPLPKAALAPD